jgi:hypothetical protein
VQVQGPHGFFAFSDHPTVCDCKKSTRWAWFVGLPPLTGQFRTVSRMNELRSLDALLMQNTP